MRQHSQIKQHSLITTNETVYNETAYNVSDNNETIISQNETTTDNNSSNNEFASENNTNLDNYTNSSIGPLRILVDYSQCNVTNKTYKQIKKLFKTMIHYFKINRTISLMKFPYKFCSEVKIPKKHTTHGIRNVDLVLYITAEYDEFSGTVAWASPCFVDDESNRPIAAQVDLNLYYLANETVSSIASTVLHELMHVLGFDPDFFNSFTWPNGTRMKEEEIFKLGKNHNLIIIPELVDMARAYFGCETLRGVPLEKGLGAGSDDSHWAEEFFQQDIIMAPVQGLNQVISNFTLALFKYTGWYNITYNNLSAMILGIGKGCDWAEHECYAQTGMNGV